jgi:UDP-glucose 4-epimerase
VTRSNEDWLATHRNNQTGSLVVFDAARGGAIPVVYASSAAVYGEQLDLPIAESATLAPLTAYGADKVGSELHGRVAWLRHGVPNVGLRIFNAYGPRQDARLSHSGAISTFLARLFANKSLTIHGDGGQVRDFVHVTDVVDHLLAAMSLERKDAQVVNVCTGTGTTVTALIDTLAAASRIAPRIVRSECRNGDIRASIGDPARARKLLHVEAATSLADGVADLVARARRGPHDGFEILGELSD